MSWLVKSIGHTWGVFFAGMDKEAGKTNVEELLLKVEYNWWVLKSPQGYFKMFSPSEMNTP